MNMSHEEKKVRFKKELYRLWGMHLSRDYKVSRRDLMKGMIGLGLSATAINMIMRKAPFGITPFDGGGATAPFVGATAPFPFAVAGSSTGGSSVWRNLRRYPLTP